MPVRSSESPPSAREKLFVLPFRSIRARLVFQFCLLFLVILTGLEIVNIWGVPSATHFGIMKTERDEAFRSLNLLADIKKEQVLLWLHERKSDAEMCSDNTLVRHAIAALLKEIKGRPASSRPDPAFWGKLRGRPEYGDLVSFLSLLRSTYNVYTRIYVIDLGRRRIIASTRGADLGRAAALHPDLAAGIAAHQEYLGEVFIDSETGRPTFSISRVISDAAPRAAALLVIEVNAEDILASVFQSGKELGKTGEAFLLDQQRRPIHRLKHPLPDGMLAKPLVYQINTTQVKLAVSGHEGSVEGADYRGEPVLVAYRYVPVAENSRWGLIVKRDTAEVLLPARRTAGYSLLAALAGMAAILLLTALTAQRVTRPILALSRAAERVAAGDLEARAAATSPDEVGLLAAIFNSMVERIRDAQMELEERVRLRTAQLTAANEELAKEIAERLRAEAALKESHGFLQAVAEGTTDVVYVKDLPGRYLMINSAGARFIGKPVAEILGQDDLALFAPESARAVMEQDRMTMAGGETKTYEEAVTAQGVTLTFLATKGPYRDAAGRVIGLIGISRDITELKRIQEELRSLNVELEQRVSERTAELTAANRELEAFAYSVSHDLRGPLRAMNGFSQALLEDCSDQLDEDGKRYLGRIRLGSRRMEELIDGILQLSRATRLEMLKGRVDLSAIAQEVAAELQSLQPERRVSFVITDGQLANGDERLLTQVIRNLLENAWKFTAKHATARIEFGSCRRDGKRVFFVRDDGAGFDMAYAQKLFGIFQRLHGMGEFEGTGIGLALIQRIIHRHGGEVWAEGEVEKGATFYFTI